MKQNLDTIENLVTSILENKPETRNSDDLLYIEYIKMRPNDCPVNFGTVPFLHFMLYYKDYGIAPLESVTRIRRKVQKDRPDLAPNKTVKGFRDNLEHEFREYARA